MTRRLVAMVQKRWLHVSLTATLLALLLAWLPGVPSRAPARAQHAPVRYTIESIGVLDGGTVSGALALNAEGTVVGYSLNATQFLRAVVYQHGELRELGGVEEM